MSISPGTLIHELAMDDQGGTPVLIPSRDYLTRRELLAGFTEEAALHRIRLIAVTNPADMAARMDGLEIDDNTALAVLIDPGTMEVWAPLLEARREVLPRHVRFLLVLLMKEDIPMLEAKAPAFWSWAKARLETEVQFDQPLSWESLAQELEQSTGRSPAEFLAAWRRGEVPDTFENSSWLNLVSAFLGEER